MLGLSRKSLRLLNTITATLIIATLSVLTFNDVFRNDHSRYRRTDVSPLQPEETTSIPCDQILNQVVDVNQSDYRIQLIAAAPGSGSDWCLNTIPLITGLRADSVYEHIHDKDVNKLPRSAFYYKTHSPFMRHFGPVDQYLSSHAGKVVLLIRNPLDAGFSEFVRKTLQNGGKKEKYANVDSLFTRKDFLTPAITQIGGEKPSKKLGYHLSSFHKQWRVQYQFWLTNYTGPVKIILYKDLVNNISLFKEITKYFGYDMDLTQSRKRRFQCFLSSKADTVRRPRVSVIESSKEIIRKHYQTLTDEALTFVEKLYNDKYKEIINID